MLGEPHDLMHEFPEYARRIAAWKSWDSRSPT